MKTPQRILWMKDNPLSGNHELVVENFAGGGGASKGIADAIGRDPDIAINHDPQAIAMHEANHRNTRHLCEDVWDVVPSEVTEGRPVGLAWFSPDCTDHSKAKGGVPVRKNIRGLAWVVIRWARQKRPRVIFLENVEEFAHWGPVVHDENGKAYADKTKRGMTFRLWCNVLRGLGYDIEWKELTASDHGIPTIRKRLFIIARCDGEPIVWPEITHAKPDVVERKPELRVWRTAAECIDWSIPCPSIFLSKEHGKDLNVKRPLAENTMRRIAKGIERYVINDKSPFIVCCNHGGEGFRGQSIDAPMNTLTAARDAIGLISPVLTSYHGPRDGDANGRCRTPAEPLATQDTSNRFGLVAPFLVPRYGEREGQEPRTLPADAPYPTVVPTANGGSLVVAHVCRNWGGMVGQPVEQPYPTITSKGCQDTIVTSHLEVMYSNSKGATLQRPMPTVVGSNHIAEVRAFLTKFYGTATGQGLNEPLHTATAKDRFGLVTIAGSKYQIVDIGMRMLSPRELFRAQGFPDSYDITTGINGKPLPKSAQVRMCGNSVCPKLAEEIVRANYVVRTPSHAS